MAIPMAGALHLLVTRRAIEEAGYGKRIVWPLGISMPWNNRPEPKSIKALTGTVRALINALGDYDWVSAIGADVLLSAVALSYWAVVGNLDARSMIESGVCPWLDNIQEAVGNAASRAKEATEGAAEHVRNGLSSATEKARHGSQELKRRTSQRYEDVGLDDNEEDEDEFGPSVMSQILAARRGRPPKPLTRERRVHPRSRSKSRASVSPVQGDTSRRRSRTRERSSSRVSLGHGPEKDDEESQILRDIAMAAAGPAEAAGVAWALFALGGLGVASTAVFGSGEL